MHKITIKNCQPSDPERELYDAAEALIIRQPELIQIMRNYEGITNFFSCPFLLCH